MTAVTRVNCFVSSSCQGGSALVQQARLLRRLLQLHKEEWQVVGGYAATCSMSAAQGLLLLHPQGGALHRPTCKPQPSLP
jgi:hypothetical protein